MATKEKGGCRKTATIVGIGCLAVPVVLLIFAGLSILIGYAFHDHEGPPELKTTSFSVPSGGRGEQGIEPGRDFEELEAAQRRRVRPVRLNIDLKEGEFEIRPGPPGSDIEAEGVFDPRDYELTQESVELDGEYEREVTIRFRRKVPLLFMLLKGGIEEAHNKVTVRIPEDLPTALKLKLSAAETETDLSGLTLTELQAFLSMGEHELAVNRPLRSSPERAVFRTSMGEMDLRGLGNLRAKEISISGRMGEVKVDLSGDWPAGFAARTDLKFSMGECHLTVPAGVRIDPASNASVFIGEGHTSALEETGPDDPDAPTVEIHAYVKLGELRISRH
jgi:hypothetical protein